MHFERRILMPDCTDSEVLLLGGGFKTHRIFDIPLLGEGTPLTECFHKVSHVSVARKLSFHFCSVLLCGHMRVFHAI